MNIAGYLSQAIWGNPSSPDIPLPDEATLHNAAKELDLQLPDEVWTLLYSDIGPLVKPISICGMKETGQAGLLQFTPGEWNSAITEARRVDEVAGQSWMEVVPMRDGQFLAYPQTANAENLRFIVWLPVAFSSSSFRLVAVDLGRDVQGETITPLRVAGNTGCSLAFDGEGEGMHLICLESGCRHGCDEFWTVERGRSQLTGCACS